MQTTEIYLSQDMVDLTWKSTTYQLVPLKYLSVDNECKRQILSLICTYQSLVCNKISIDCALGEGNKIIIMDSQSEGLGVAFYATGPGLGLI